MTCFWTPHHFASLLNGRWIGKPCDTNVPLTGISINTRTLKPGNVFIAIPGERFDGHDFIPQAVGQGSTFAIVQQQVNGPALYVDDTVIALQTLARAWRDELARHHCKVIAITGSSGKTSTRHLIHHVLSARYTGSQSPKSFNNHLGVPLTLLAAKSQHDFVVAEVGTNHPGEIAQLGDILRPDAVVITTIGRAHLGNFGSCEAIEREKRSLYDFVKPGGLKVEPDRPPEDSLTQRLAWPGEPMKRNAQVAVEVARWMGLDDAVIAQQFETVSPIEGRLEILRYRQRVIVIHDAYNANPDSTAAAIEVLFAMPGEPEGAGEPGEPGGRRVFIFGDMLELGEVSDAAHQQAGELFREKARSGDILFTLGTAAHQAGGLRENLDTVVSQLQPGDTVLLKASHGMHLERLLPKIEKRFGSADIFPGG